MKVNILRQNESDLCSWKVFFGTLYGTYCLVRLVSCFCWPTPPLSSIFTRENIIRHSGNVLWKQCKPCIGNVWKPKLILPPPIAYRYEAKCLNQSDVVGLSCVEVFRWITWNVERCTYEEKNVLQQQQQQRLQRQTVVFPSSVLPKRSLYGVCECAFAIKCARLCQVFIFRLPK